MLSLLKKEITSYFNSITGYLVIILFLVLNSLIIWVFPGNFNILDSGYASLQNYFIIAPWVFLLLVPAITMRSFAEEKRTGTIELIFTKPISITGVITAKFFASFILVIISLIPTLLYYIVIYYFAFPTGNVDIGGTWGSFIGLFFLTGIYCSIGIFSSSLSDNQIISLLTAIVLCFISYLGFDAIGNLPVFQNHAGIIFGLGINEHYQSMSRGVIDSRDLVYFISATILFLYFTKLKLSEKK